MANLFLIGDSMIEFFDWQQRFPAHRAVNLGRSGETTGELLARLPSILALKPQPDWLLIMTGTNDVCMENFGFLNTYAQIIGTCQNKLPTTAITVNSLLPIQLPYLAADVVPRLNQLLQDLATDKQTHYLDGFRALVDGQGRPLPAAISPDGVHLTSAGYRLWADQVAEHLPTVFP